MKRVLAIVAVAVANLWNFAHGAAPTITSTAAAPDGGVIIRWSSETDKIYRIDFAPSLTEPMQWQQLYTDYPSHGTSTFWKDVGNEFAFPGAGHPADGPMRFYRVVEIGANSLSKPQVSVISPAESAVLSDMINVTLSLSSSIPMESVRLFVDGGEAVLAPFDVTQFQLNTCEFPNGTRTILAVARNSSGGETTEEASTYVENSARSPLRTVTFNNYISEFRASERLFEPAENQNARFVAKFAAYSDWTLVIKDLSDTAVRTVSGTDYRLNFLWDGRGDGGVALPGGNYTATLSAQPSAQSPPPPPGGGPVESPPSPSSATSSDEEFWYFESPPLPPPLEAEFGKPAPHKVRKTTRTTESSAAQNSETTLMTEATGQTTTIGPVRLGYSGTFAIAYQGHHPGGTFFPMSSLPDDGLFGTVTVNAGPGAYPRLRSLRNLSSGLESVLGRAGLRLVNKLVDDELTIADLDGTPYGGRGTLNEANLGILCGHGVFGMEPDYTISASGPRQTYTPLYQTGNNFYDWFRISNGDFGGAFRDSSGTVRLGNMRWMCILTCNNLQPDCYDDMYNKEVLPITDNLHLLLGCSTTSYMVSAFGVHFGHALTGVFMSPTPQRSLAEAWFYAGVRTQGTLNPAQPVVFRVSGWPNCFGDAIDNFQSPDSGNPGDIEFIERQVFP